MILIAVMLSVSIPPIFGLRNRVVVWLENQPVGMNQIHCILSLSVTHKLVSSVRSGCRHHRQCPSVLQYCEAHFDGARNTVTISPSEFLI